MLRSSTGWLSASENAASQSSVVVSSVVSPRIALSCRGVLISGRTNTARTLMTEAILRHLSQNRLPVVAGGFYHREAPHPLVFSYLKRRGIDTASLVPHRSISVLMAAGKTYDVFIGIGQQNGSPSVESPSSSTSFSSINHSDLHSNKSLFPEPNSHWGVSKASTDRMPSWKVFSPTAPSIMHENSTAKFQDYNYEGEPLFYEATPTGIRKQVKISELWEIPSLTVGSGMGPNAQRFKPMERPVDEMERVDEMFEKIMGKCEVLCRRLEAYYQEPILLTRTK